MWDIERGLGAGFVIRAAVASFAALAAATVLAVPLVLAAQAADTLPLHFSAFAVTLGGPEIPPGAARC